MLNYTILDSMMLLKSKCPDLYTHSLNTAKTAVSIGIVLHPNSFTLEEVRDAALLHDIGKTNVPNSILEKRGGLDEKEWESMRFHPQWGAEILRSMRDATTDLLDAVAFKSLVTHLFVHIFPLLSTLIRRNC